MSFSYKPRIGFEIKHYVQQQSCRYIDIQFWFLRNVEHYHNKKVILVCQSIAHISLHIPIV